jgi:plasmid replication initiation protein
MGNKKLDIVKNEIPAQLTLFPAKVTKNSQIAQAKQLVFSRYNMTLIEHNIFLLMLAQIRKDDAAFKPIEIPFSMVTSKGGKSYDLIYTAVRNLYNFGIELYSGSQEKESRRWVGITVFRYMTIDERRKTVIAQFNDNLAPLLLDLSNKGNYNLIYYHNVYKLNTFYSRRIYDFLHANKDNPNGIKFKYSSLRQWLKLEKTYKTWTLFRRKILDPSQKRLERTNLAFEYSVTYEGKFVDAVEFHLKAVSKSSDGQELKETHSNDETPSTKPTALIPALNVLNGVDFLFAIGAFTDEEIIAIKSSIKRTDINRRIAKCKMCDDYGVIREYFNDILSSGDQMSS